MGWLRSLGAIAMMEARVSHLDSNDLTRSFPLRGIGNRFPRKSIFWLFREMFLG